MSALHKAGLAYLLLLALLAGCNAGQDGPRDNTRDDQQNDRGDDHRLEFGSAVIRISSSAGMIDYRVEVAADAQSRARGLMYRTALPAGHGMLLRYRQPQPVSIWMKDTPLPLDILYIAADGEIVKIIQGAAPHSLEPMPSGQPVLAVLEINAGQVARHQIKPGDKVINF